MADEPRISQHELMALTQSYMPTTPETFKGRGAIIPRLAFDLRDARRFGDDLASRAREVTCVWCGHQFETTLSQQREHLLAHAEICEQSPYRDCRAQLEAVTRERDDLKRAGRAFGQEIIRLENRVAKLETAGTAMRKYFHASRLDVAWDEAAAVVAWELAIQSKEYP